MEANTYDIELVRPTARYAAQVMAYRDEMLQNGDSLDGCAALEDCESYAQWADFGRRLKRLYGDGYVPSEVFLAVRKADDMLVGIIDYRHPLSDFLSKFGGNIGYSVRPGQRRRGYATQMLSLILPICREFGEDRVLITCDKDNIASAKTIRANGGVFECDIEDTAGLCGGGIIERYWIELPRPKPLSEMTLEEL